MIERTATERYQLYLRGYTDGAVMRFARHEGEPDYEQGYKDGSDDRNKRLSDFAKAIEYKPSILRSV